MAGNGDGLFQRGEFWSFRYRDNKNQWRERSTGQSKKAEARKEKQRFLDDLNNGKLPSEMATWTLKQACDHWLTWRAATKPGRTAATERSFLRRVLTVFWGKPNTANHHAARFRSVSVQAAQTPRYAYGGQIAHGQL